MIRSDGEVLKLTLPGFESSVLNQSKVVSTNRRVIFSLSVSDGEAPGGFNMKDSVML